MDTPAAVTMSRELARNAEILPREVVIYVKHVHGYGICEGFHTNDGYFIVCSMVVTFADGHVYRVPMDSKVAMPAVRCRPVEYDDYRSVLDDPLYFTVNFAMLGLDAAYEVLCKRYK